jgi:hypothetical protein
MSHLLMATIGFEAFRESFFAALGRLPDRGDDVDAGAQTSYAHENSDVASLKYPFNFVVDPATRDSIVRAMFIERLGDEPSFARSLYFTFVGTNVPGVDNFAIKRFDCINQALA